jgi:hypothetical protein
MIGSRMPRAVLAFLGLSLLLGGAAAWAQEELKTYPMGDAAQAGEISYTVMRAWWQKFPDFPRPDDLFLGLDVIVLNSGTKLAQIPPFQLFDNEGRRYEPNFSKIVFPTMMVDPNGEVRGTLYFHVPKDRKYRLLASGTYGSHKFAYISLDKVEGGS